MFGSLQLTLLTTATALVLGFIAGTKWEDGKHAEEMLLQQNAQEAAHVANLETQRKAWEAEAGKIVAIMAQYQAQVALDQVVIQELNDENVRIKEKFDDLMGRFPKGPMGYCKFTGDTVQLLNDASRAANDRSSMSGDSS